MVNSCVESIDVSGCKPLRLAYIGDAVYEVYIREMLLRRKNVSVHKLHVESIQYVKAAAQSYILHEIMDKLTDEELDIVRRGRNAKSATVPKNAKVSDYRYATAFETLVGYLYLGNNKSRLNEIIDMAVNVIDKKMSKDVEKS